MQETQKEGERIQEHIEYDLVTSFLSIENEEYVTYGISGPGVLLSDVSVDKGKVEDMLRKLNESQLEPCHFMDFVEDELV